jgi:hypothetical protein
MASGFHENAGLKWLIFHENEGLEWLIFHENAGLKGGSCTECVSQGGKNLWHVVGNYDTLDAT